MRLSFNTYGNEKQKECCRAWISKDITDIYYGGAKGGAKSFTGVALNFGDALTYPDTRFFIARKKLNDLRKFTLPTIGKVFEEFNVLAICKKEGIDVYRIKKNLPTYDKEYANKWIKALSQKIIVQEKYVSFNGHDNFFQCYNGSKILLLEGAFQPSDPLYERFGSMEFTRGMIEEAGEFALAAKNNLAASIGRWKNDKYDLVRKLLQTGNPSKNYTYKDYYRPFTKGTLKPHQQFIQAFIQDNKMIDSGYIEQLEQSLSKNEKQRLLHGNWEYDDDPSVLIEYEKIIDIFTNTFVSGGPRYITSDIARLGGDRIVIIEWDGWRGRVRELPKGLLNQTATYIEAARSRIQCGKNDVLIDADGIGQGVSDFVGYKEFKNGSKALPDPMKPYTEDGKDNVEQFDMLKSQCYFRLADRINRNGLYLECESEEQQQLIIEELEQVKQKHLDSDMKKGVMPKDKVKEIIGRSPDFADTIMMREYFELHKTRQFADAAY